MPKIPNAFYYFKAATSIRHWFGSKTTYDTYGVTGRGPDGPSDQISAGYQVCSYTLSYRGVRMLETGDWVLTLAQPPSYRAMGGSSNESQAYSWKRSHWGLTPHLWASYSSHSQFCVRTHVPCSWFKSYVFWLPAWWALWLLWWPLTDAAMFQCVYGYLQSVFFFLVLFHCCILLEIKLTTTTTLMLFFADFLGNLNLWPLVFDFSTGSSNLGRMGS